MPEARITETVDAALPHRGIVRLVEGDIVNGDVAAFLLDNLVPFAVRTDEPTEQELAAKATADAPEADEVEAARVAAAEASDAAAVAAIDAVAAEAVKAVKAPSPADVAKAKV